MSKLTRALGRTLKSNISIYQIDGSGRDSYISYNNGGFWKDNFISGKNKQRTSAPRRKYTLISLTRNPPPFKYWSDGSGRDSYISYNEGGLVQKFTANNSIELSSYLRNDNSVNNRSKRGFMGKAEKKEQRILKGIERNVTKRLYEKDKRKYLPLLRKTFCFNNNRDTMLRSYSSMNLYEKSHNDIKKKENIIPSVKKNIIIIKKIKINKK